MTTIIEALQKLDPNNDNHWTADGLPRIDTIKFMASNQSITREDITAAAPNFKRTNADFTGGTTAPTNTEQTPSGENSGTPLQNLTDGLQAAKDAVNETFNSPDVQEKIKDVAESLQAFGFDSWEDEHKSAQARIEAATKKYNVAKQELHEANLYFDDVVSRSPENSKETPTQTIQAYLASQQKQALEQAEAQNTLKEAGIDLDSVRKLVGQSDTINKILS